MEETQVTEGMKPIVGKSMREINSVMSAKNTQMKQYVQEGRKPGTNTEKSDWVQFPDGKFYLLARYRANINMKPIFTGNEVKLEMDHTLPQVADAVEHFALSLAHPVANTSEGDVLMLAGAGLDMYIAFLKMLKVLLAENYDWPDEKYNELLSFNPKQYGKFLKPILTHVFYKV